jgi:sigma-B regulation protein RsbQ
MTDVLKRNNVTISGAGEKVMLFAHGFGCDQNSWNYIREAFTPGYKLVLFDYVGAGKSDTSAYDPVKYDSLEGYSTDILEICEALELTDVIFIGHSVSCMAGVMAAIKSPGIFKKLIFIGPSPCYINKDGYIGGFEKDTIDDLLEVMEEDYISWSRSMAPVIMNIGNGEEMVAELGDSFCSIDPVIGKQFARVTFLSDNRTDLERVPVASLTIQCSGDMIAPLSVGKYIHSNMPGNTLTVLDAAGHCPHMSHPKETVEAIEAYLGRL